MINKQWIYSETSHFNLPATLPFLFNGCATAIEDPPIEMAPPAYVEELAPLCTK